MLKHTVEEDMLVDQDSLVLLPLSKILESVLLQDVHYLFFGVFFFLFFFSCKYAINR